MRLSLSLWVLGLAAAPASAAPAPEARRVVILTGTDVMHPASLVEDGTIRSVLSSAGIGSIEFHSEGLDAYRFRSADYEQELIAFLQRKYRERRPDVVFALGELATSFLLNERDRIWPGAPVVFTSVAEEHLRGRDLPSWTTGFLEHSDAAGTVRLAQRLQPGLRRVLVVGGAADRDRIMTSRAVEALGAFRPRLEVRVPAAVAEAEFAREFGSLSKDTAIVFTSMFRDSKGRALTPKDAARTLAAVSSAPVYALYSTQFGVGVLGGSMVDFEREARSAAEVALRILRGESPASIPVQRQSPPLLAVDGRQLARFGIPKSRVPAEAELRFHTPSLWEQYRWRVVAVAVALALETALLIALIAGRRKRRLAEEEAAQRRRELAHAARLATVGELTAAISHEINQPLCAILANAEAAEMLLDGENGGLREVRQILADIRRDDVRASEVVRRVRSLAGKQEMKRRSLDVNLLVETVVRLLEHEARRQGVAVETDLGKDLPQALGDEVSLQQMIINLALNGMEAMAGEAADRRRLVIRTRSDDGRISVRVSDSGRGIAEANRPRLFESFFTTKPQGVGLGLSICRSIVEAHGGSIEAVDAATGGAAFEFTLPACVREEATLAAAAAEPAT